MKPRRFLLSFLLVTALFEAPAQAGLAEATDYDGVWISSSSSGYVPDFHSPNFWVDQSAITLDGEDAVMGVLPDYTAERTWIESEFTGPCTLYFSYHTGLIAGAYGGDFIVSARNAVKVLLVGFGVAPSSEGWREEAISLGNGKWTVRWDLYATRGSTNKQGVYVDQVWTSADPRPRITTTSFTGAYSKPGEWAIPVASSTPYTLTATGLPPGLTLSPATGVVSGRPLKSGVFEATMTAQNAAGKHVAIVSFDIAYGTASIADALDNDKLKFSLLPDDPSEGWVGLAGFGHHDADCIVAGYQEYRPYVWPTLSYSVEGPGTFSYSYYIKFPKFSDFVNVSYTYVAVHQFLDDQSPMNMGVGQIHRQLNEWNRVSVEIPPRSHTLRLMGMDADFYKPRPKLIYLDEIDYISRGAEISLALEPGLTPVSNRASQSFGSVAVRESSYVSYQIRNTGVGNLVGLENATIEGPDAGSFGMASVLPAAIAGPSGSASMVLRFAPLNPGAKTATLRLPNNDFSNNPFLITLTGEATAGAIASGPSSQEALVGGPVTFSAAANEPEASFQWMKDGVEIPGAVGPQLTLSSVQPWHIGDYSVRVAHGANVVTSPPASLRLKGVPEGIWRGLVSYYPFDGKNTDELRPGFPAELMNGVVAIADPKRGPVLSISGAGFAVPPFDWEDPAAVGPGGSVRIPRPVSGLGESFTISLWVRERGYSSWHGEAFLTLGEAGTSSALLGRNWVGGLQGLTDHYGPNEAPAAGILPPPAATVAADGTAVIGIPSWVAWTVVASGSTLKYYRQGIYQGSAPYRKDTAGDLFVGRHWWMDGVMRSSTRFRGEVDDVRIYNRALSEEEVRQLHGSTQPSALAESYTQWTQSSGLAGSSADWTADPDHDGLTNLEEYAFGTDPQTGSPGASRWETLVGAFNLSWLGRFDSRYRAMKSYDLRTWENIPSSAPITPAPDQAGAPPGYQRLQIRLAPLPREGLYAVRIAAEFPPLLPNDARISMDPPDGEPKPGQQVSLAAPGGLSSVTYQWWKDGVLLANATSRSFVLPVVSPENSGAYRVSVTNSIGTTFSRPAYVRVTSANLPSVTTSPPVAASAVQATMGGLVVEDGGDPVLERGVVYSTAGAPVLGWAQHVTAGVGVGPFEVSLTGLAPKTTYHVRAYAFNAKGVSYGEDLTVTTPAE